MDSDEVNTIGETVESRDISQTLREVYYEMVIDLRVPENDSLFELVPSLTTDKPVLMTLPDNVASVQTIKYNVQELADTHPLYQTMQYVEFNEFLDRQSSLRESTTGVGSMTFSSNAENFEIMYMTDRDPSSFTVFDDETIMFDSFDAAKDSTLQKSKTLCTGLVYPIFTVEDDFIPDLDLDLFPLLINKTKTRVFVEARQTRNVEAERSARRQLIAAQHRKNRAPHIGDFGKVPKYGRK